jgi:hypothetical protein
MSLASKNSGQSTAVTGAGGGLGRDIARSPRTTRLWSCTHIGPAFHMIAHVLELLAVAPVLRVAVVGRSSPATSVTSTSRCTPMHSLPPGFTEVVLPMASWPFDAVEISAFR